MSQIVGNPANGTGGQMLGLGANGVGQVVIMFGPGSPATSTDASVESAAVGSLYLRLDGGAGTCLYVREPNGWVGK
jgi:hypothetical protein